MCLKCIRIWIFRKTTFLEYIRILIFEIFRHSKQFEYLETFLEHFYKLGWSNIFQKTSSSWKILLLGALRTDTWGLMMIFVFTYTCHKLALQSLDLKEKNQRAVYKCQTTDWQTMTKKFKNSKAKIKMIRQFSLHWLIMLRPWTRSSPWSLACVGLLLYIIGYAHFCNILTWITHGFLLPKDIRTAPNKKNSKLPQTGTSSSRNKLITRPLHCLMLKRQN